MDKQPLLPTSEQSQQHYRVPEGYFDQLEERIMARLPEESRPSESEQAPARPSLWVRVRPIVYLTSVFVSTGAAVFVSMNLVFRAFHSTTRPEQTASRVATERSTEDQDEAYSTYYAEYGAEIATQDAHEYLFADGDLAMPADYTTSSY